MQHDFIYAFRNPKIIKYKNTYLLEFKCLEVKTGYFLGQIVDGVFVIQTFLFLTNTGTPEGDALNNSLKVRNLDKEFLGIDKLITYMKLNPENMKEMAQIFQGTGCEHLINLKEHLKKYNLELEENEYSQTLTKYFSYSTEDVYENPELLTNEPVNNENEIA